jgi:hypothetical protein
MKPSRVVVASLALTFGAGSVPSLLAFQEPSLAELAKQEKKRRKAAAAAAEKKTRTITEDDLRAGPGATANPVADAEPGASPAASPAAAPGATPEKTDAELRAEKQAEIQKRVDEQKARMDKVREVMAEAQLELNDLANQTFGGRRAALMKLIDDGNAELAACEARIADLEEEARRAGVRVSR